MGGEPIDLEQLYEAEFRVNTPERAALDHLFAPIRNFREQPREDEYLDSEKRQIIGELERLRNAGQHGINATYGIKMIKMDTAWT